MISLAPATLGKSLKQQSELIDKWCAIMDSQRIGSRGMVFTFSDPYHFNVYVIIGNRCMFICDTFCGPDPMEEIIESLKGHGFDTKSTRRIAFNSHHHYDHIWGNSVFSEDTILAHEACKELIHQHGEESLRKYRDHAKGEVELTYPNVLFYQRIEFPEEQVVFFHSPGHTEDSASCLDLKDKVLFVGDNVETPIPFFYQPSFKAYETTMREYASLKWKTMIASHDPILEDDRLLKRNLEYIQELSTWKVDFDTLDENTLSMHLMNLGSLAEIMNPKEIGDEAIEHFKEALGYLYVIRPEEWRLETESKIKSLIRK